MEHGRLQHSQLYEENLGIPLIIRHPEQEHGFRVKSPVSNSDLLATLLGLVGLESPVGGMGKNLWQAVSAGSLLPAVKTVPMGNRMERGASLRRGQWKLIVECSTERRELYDVVRDAAERDDLASRRPDLVRSLEADLWSAVGRENCDDLRQWAPLGGAARGIDADQEEALKALGYLQE